MLQTLSIRDFVIVDQLNLDFGLGFTVLTGETGAGKSILIDALSLALGGRSEGGITRAGCERAEISAEFNIRSLPELQAWLRENELQGEGGELYQLLSRRVIYADGRSRAFINGSPATIQQLREAGEFLVDIYSQHAHHSLLKQSYQRQTLDQFAGLAEMASQVSNLYREWFSLHQRRIEMEKNATAYADELADLRDQVRELVNLKFVPDEWENLQQEHSRLSNGASLLASAEMARDILSESDVSALHHLHTAQHKLQDMVEYDESLQEALDTLDSAIIQLEETDRFLNRYLQRTELDPARLAEVEGRIKIIYGASRKYRIRPEELTNLLAEKQNRMVALEESDMDGELSEKEVAANAEFLRLAQKLSSARQIAAKALSERITTEMQRLALAGGAFLVTLAPQEAAETGLEEVDFQVAGHAGVLPRPLSKVVSGGELSRISLAIRVVTAQQGDIPTMIFDEVDVGIGGGVAEIVGQLLNQLGHNRQILVITHLPQVAAQGAQHLRVSKSLKDGITLSHISVLSEAERIEEIARMLGGLEITATTRQHAQEMLGLSH
jgi:DNA repair protein RecN (Recombination protein N)